MKEITLSIAVAAIVTASSSAFAQSVPDFKGIDVNADGYLTVEEWKSSGHSKADFAKLDADNNQFVSSTEFLDATGSTEATKDSESE